MKKRVLEEFYPISKTSDMRMQIKSFRQLPGELFHEAYERLKELLRACPHYEIPKWELVKVFHDSIDSQNRQFLLAASGGAFLTRTSEDEWTFFEQLSKGSKTQASVNRKQPSTSRVNHMSDLGSSSRNLKQELDDLKMLIFNNPNQDLACNVSHVQEVCEICGDPSHFAHRCRNEIPSVNQQIMEEHVNEIQGRRFDPYSNTSPPNQPSSSDAKMDAFISEMQKIVEVQNNSIGALAKEIGNVAESKGNREPGTIPTYTVLNLNHKDSGKGHSVNMVGTLRSGKKYDNKVGEKEENEVSENINLGKGVENKEPIIEEIGKSGTEPKTVPFPKALKSTNQFPYGKKGPQPEGMWETFKQVKINLPLLDAIKQVPSYAKFLKDLCTQRRKQRVTLPKKVELTEHLSAVVLGTLPPKFKDPETSLIAVTIGNINVKKALLDLGASINILPFCLVDQFELGLMKRTDIIIQLVDQSIKMPRGMLEDVIVKVEDFYYLVDFVVMDIEPTNRDAQPTIILGGPFLEQALMEGLNKYKATVGWTIADLKGISASVCMHRIVTDPEVKTSRDTQ
ncbi:uncharacterized protein [Rutidosis leptorrhynchoides]|uniref:uncharacterized protein n=1 Tax=Rutidosis leptorrhynchoides TaxID=125765 RepID=UPI003A98CE57